MYVVTTTIDFGGVDPSGKDFSLRDAISFANESGEPSTVLFNFTGDTTRIDGLPTITVDNPLQAITVPIAIDGTSGYGSAIHPGVQLRGVPGDGTGDGLLFSGSGATGSVVRGLAIGGFQDNGISLFDVSGVSIQTCYVGTNGTGEAANGNGIDGIALLRTSNITIGGFATGTANVMSGNAGDGIGPVSSSQTAVVGNRIGTNAAGSAALVNASNGVEVDAPSQGTTIGGTAPGSGNVISANGGNGVRLDGGASPTALNAVIAGNIIGLDATATKRLGNAYQNICAYDATGNTIGGTVAGETNVIGASGQVGLWIDTGSTGNLVAGNLIGTNSAGASGLGKSYQGIYDNAPNNTIGAVAGPAQVIVGSGNNGVAISAAAPGALVQGNLIGIGPGGSAIPNSQDGVLVLGPGATIGGTSAAARNVISGNGQAGVSISGSAASREPGRGRLHRHGFDRASAIANQNNGVAITGGASSNTIGGSSAAGAGDLISGNAPTLSSGDGVYISDAGTTGNLVLGNTIGLNVSGAVLGNGYGGVDLRPGASANTIGGTSPSTRNILSGNVIGVLIVGSASNLVEGNSIGTDPAGNSARPNSFGVLVSNGATSNTIGGNAALGAGNVISGNSLDGVEIRNSGANGNVLVGDLIGLNAMGNALGNGRTGVQIYNNSGNTVGGSSPALRNVISSNSADAVDVFGLGAFSNVILGNDIGTDPTGTTARANGGVGVALFSSAHGNTIGGALPGSGNVISGNSGAGVSVLGSQAVGDSILGDLIFANGTIGIDLGGDGATPNHPGGAVSGPNSLQNHPVLTSAYSTPMTTILGGTLDSLPNSSFRVEMFAGPPGGGSSVFLGFATVATGGSGHGSFSFQTAFRVDPGWVVTATATDSSGDTSEFSAPATVSQTTDVTSSVTVVRGGFVITNRKLGTFSQEVTIRNTSGHALLGPISPVLDGLANASLVNSTGVTGPANPPAGSPYLDLVPPLGSLADGGSVTVYLVFSDPTFRTISYTAKVLAGGGPR